VVRGPREIKGGRNGEGEGDGEGWERDRGGEDIRSEEKILMDKEEKPRYHSG